MTLGPNVKIKMAVQGRGSSFLEQELRGKQILLSKGHISKAHYSSSSSSKRRFVAFSQHSFVIIVTPDICSTFAAEKKDFSSYFFKVGPHGNALKKGAVLCAHFKLALLFTSSCSSIKYNEWRKYLLGQISTK